MKNKLQGTWEIIETDMWDKESLDMEDTAVISFNDQNQGELSFVAIESWIDYRFDKQDNLIEFSFEGTDAGRPICGRGKATFTNDQILGTLFIHNGDESTFKAKRLPS